MYRTGLFALAFGLSLSSLGCDKGGSHSSSASTADKKVVEADKKMKDAVDATVVAAQAKRDEYARDMQKRLAELDAKYDELKVRAEKAEGDMKKDLDKKLAEAKVKRDAAAAKLDELKSASADRWEKIKDGVGNAFDDLKKAFE
jgi:hypothetical protein